MLTILLTYISLGILFNLFIDFLVWLFFKLEVLPLDDAEFIPWDTRTKFWVTFAWPLVMGFLLLCIFIKPSKKENNE